MEATHAIAALEESRATISTDLKAEQYNQHYTRLLTAYPMLEGFWIRWAHTTFSLQGCDEAIAVFERALAVPFLDNSVRLWVEYLRFMVHLMHTARPINPETTALFERAANKIGTHFLAHEFWDLYLEVCPNKLVLLKRVLTSTTMHQITRFYLQLKSLILQSDFEDLNAVLNEPEQVLAPTLDSERQAELQRFQEVVLTKLKFQYELHTRRVKSVCEYELNIKRPFFYPKPVSKHDLNNWVAYIIASPADQQLALFGRALIPLALNENMWMMYIRYLIHNQFTNEQIETAFKHGSHLEAVNKLHEVWTKPADQEPELTQLRRTNPKTYLNRIGSMSFADLEKYAK